MLLLSNTLHHHDTVLKFASFYFCSVNQDVNIAIFCIGHKSFREELEGLLLILEVFAIHLVQFCFIVSTCATVVPLKFVCTKHTSLVTFTKLILLEYLYCLSIISLKTWFTLARQTWKDKTSNFFINKQLLSQAGTIR